MGRAIFFALVLISSPVFAQGINIFGIGIYDIKFDGSSTKQATDFRYERRLDKTLFDIGPKEDNFFFLKPFFGIEYTSDSATYFLSGIYVEDNLGQLFEGRKNNLFFTPSFGAGIYDDGSGKKIPKGKNS